MPLGFYDFTLEVDASGQAISPKQDAYNMRGFAVKCAPNATWDYEILDGDNFIVATSAGIGQITGPSNVPVDRRCVGFFFILKNATPGTYVVRVNAD